MLERNTFSNLVHYLSLKVKVLLNLFFGYKFYFNVDDQLGGSLHIQLLPEVYDYPVKSEDLTR